MEIQNRLNKELFDAVIDGPTAAAVKFQYFANDHICIGSYIGNEENILPTFMHTHDAYEFFIPKTPINSLMRDRVSYFGGVGMVYPVMSGMSHGISYCRADTKFDSITVSKEYLEEILVSKNCARLRFETVMPQSEALRTFIQLFKKECRKPIRDEKNKVEPLARLICAEIIDLARDTKNGKVRSKTTYQKGVRSVIDYINDHYDEETSLETLAAICGLSVGYFTRCFKRMFGCSPVSYIAMIRISKAKILLESTLLPVKTIAEKVGYHRSSTFCDAFKKSTGITPNEYRAQVLNYSEGLIKRN